MIRKAFRMAVNPGELAEYERRHSPIWQELQDVLVQHGAHDYSIFLDEVSLTLFAVLRLTPDNTRGKLPSLPIMRRWWAFMADLMEVDQTNKPVERALTPVFHMD